MFVAPGKRRKETGGFPGADLILAEIKNKPARRRVGFLSKGPTARGEWGNMGLVVKKLGPEVRKVFSCSIDLNMTFQLLITAKIMKNYIFFLL